MLGQRTSGGDFGTFDGDMLVIYSIDRRGKLAAVFQVWTRCQAHVFGQKLAVQDSAERHRYRLPCDVCNYQSEN